MGRHSATAPVHDREPAPITDPRLLDRPLPPHPRTTAPSADPRPDLLAQPFQPVPVRTSSPSDVAVLQHRTASPSMLAPRRTASKAGAVASMRPRAKRSSDVSVPRTAAAAFTRKREAALAAAALAVVGVMSGAAALLPSGESEAQAATKLDPVTAPVPSASTASSGSALVCFSPQQLKRAMRLLHHHRTIVGAPASAAPAASSNPTSSSIATSANATPTSSASASASASAPASASTSTSTKPSPAPATHEPVSASPVGQGALPAAPGNLGTGIYTVRNFLSQSSGSFISGGVLKGAGVGRTVVEMAAGTSTQAAAVPGNGNNQGGLANPVNPLYLIRGVNRLEDVTVRGTAQGHLYNGVYMNGANIVIKHAEIDSIPGNSHANPGETFAVNVNRATGTNTIDDLTIHGGSGALTSAAGLAINNSDAHFDISHLTTTNLKYSAGIALWQVRGTYDVHDYVQKGGARSLGAERMAGTVNLYDPVWDAGTTGHDVTYTWEGGYSGGSINFRYSSAAKVPNRKLVVLTNKAAGVTGSVHVYIGGVLQPTSKYVTFV